MARHLAVAFALVAKQKLDDSNSATGGCVGNECPQPGYDARNQARASGDFATAFVVAGSALAAGGLTLWLLAPRHGGGSSATIHLIPTAAPGLAALTMRGGW